MVYANIILGQVAKENIKQRDFFAVEVLMEIQSQHDTFKLFVVLCQRSILYIVSPIMPEEKEFLFLH